MKLDSELSIIISDLNKIMAIRIINECDLRSIFTEPIFLYFCILMLSVVRTFLLRYLFNAIS